MTCALLVHWPEDTEATGPRSGLRLNQTTSKVPTGSVPQTDLASELRPNPGTAAASLGDTGQISPFPLRTNGTVVSHAALPQGKSFLLGGLSEHPSIRSCSVTGPREGAEQSSYGCQSKPCQTPLSWPWLWFPGRFPSWAGGRGSVSRDLCPSVPVCPLDNAHLCESLYSTAQE